MRIRYILLIALCVIAPLMWASYKGHLHLRTRARQTGLVCAIIGTTWAAVLWRMTWVPVEIYIPYFGAMTAMIALLVYVGVIREE